MERKAQWIADLMKADGLTAETFDALDASTKTDLIMGYMDTIGKKIEAIQNTFLTRNGAREAMGLAVIALTK